MKFFGRRRRPAGVWLTTTDPLEIVNQRRLIRRFEERERFEAAREPSLVVTASLYGYKEYDSDAWGVDLTIDL